MPEAPSAASMSEMARWACETLSIDGARDLAAARTAAWARQIAVVALFLGGRFGASREEALCVAVREIALRCNLTPASVKKNRSEARAILDFGWPGGAPCTAPGAQPADLLHDLAAHVGAVRLADVRERRAAALHGARGGRPVTGSMRILALVRSLCADTAPAAQKELAAIRAELAV